MITMLNVDVDYNAEYTTIKELVRDVEININA